MSPSVLQAMVPKPGFKPWFALVTIVGEAAFAHMMRIKNAEFSMQNNIKASDLSCYYIVFSTSYNVISDFDF